MDGKQTNAPVATSTRISRANRYSRGAGRATRRRLVMVLRQGFLLMGIGVAIGVGAALAMARLMTTLLFGVSAGDPPTFIGVAALVAFVALVAW